MNNLLSLDADVRVVDKKLQNLKNKVAKYIRLKLSEKFHTNKLTVNDNHEGFQVVIHDADLRDIDLPEFFEFVDTKKVYKFPLFISLDRSVRHRII